MHGEGRAALAAAGEEAAWHGASEQPAAADEADEIQEAAETEEAFGHPFDLLAALADVAAAGAAASSTPQQPAAAGACREPNGPAAMEVDVEEAAEVGYAGSELQEQLAPGAGAAGGVPQATDQAQQQQQQQQHDLPALPRQASTASAAALTQPPPSPASGSGMLGSGSGALAERLEAAAGRKVAQALVAFESADLANPESMLRPLRILAAANKGGQVLKDVVRAWPSYPPEQRQEVYDAALLATHQGDWLQLEESLTLALDLL